MTRKPIISITIRPELLSRLDDLADAQGIARSALISKLVEDGIEQEETTVKALAHPVLGPAMVRAFSQPEVIRAMAAVIGQELDPDQLKLFKSVMGEVHAGPPAAAAAATPGRRDKRKPKKRGK